MTIAIEADFRSINASKVVDSPERMKGNTGGGEAFASSLARVRNTEAADASVVSSEATAATIAIAFPPEISEPAILPENAVVNTGASQPLGADAAAALVKSEIVVDRRIVREGVDAQAETTPDLEAAVYPASPPRAQAEGATEAAAPVAPKASVTTDKASSAATEEVSKIAAHGAAEPALVAGGGHAPVLVAETPSVEIVAAPAAIAAVPSALPTTASTNAKAPVNRQTQQIEASADPDAFAISRQNGEQLGPPNGRLAETEVAPFTDVTGKGNPVETASLNSTTATSTQTLAAVAAPATPQGPAAASSLLPSAPAIAVVTASPAQIVGIVAETADDGQSDRVVVQLDPPELGRVSIDFKFDAQGLQHVTITSETPEAMRLLRQMHSELVQSLERHGIGSENLSFQHQQQGSPQSRPPNPFVRAAVPGNTGTDSAAINVSTDSIPGPRTLPGGRLDIRL